MLQTSGWNFVIRYVRPCHLHGTSCSFVLHIAHGPDAAHIHGCFMCHFHGQAAIKSRKVYGHIKGHSHINCLVIIQQLLDTSSLCKLYRRCLYATKRTKSITWYFAMRNHCETFLSFVGLHLPWGSPDKRVMWEWKWVLKEGRAERNYCFSSGVRH